MRPAAALVGTACFWWLSAAAWAGPIGTEPPRAAGAAPVGEGSLLESIDWPALAELTDLDEAQLRDLCRRLQEEFQGEYVLDLAPFAELARLLLPLLEQHERLRPYAGWLRARLDYLEVARELRVLMPPPLEPAWPPARPPAIPSLELERRVWRERLKEQPLPARAREHVPRLKPIFAAEGVPPALVWVAEVESGFDPRARSPAGAAGLFQLMPDTARALGLALWPWDSRLDPEKNARAAARYLKYLHGKFADWTLVLAAYNAGEGRVRRLLQKHQARRYEQIASHLPAETQLYVPRVEGTLLRREGLALADLGPPSVAK